MLHFFGGNLKKISEFGIITAILPESLGYLVNFRLKPHEILVFWFSKFTSWVCWKNQELLCWISYQIKQGRCYSRKKYSQDESIAGTEQNGVYWRWVVDKPDRWIEGRKSSWRNQSVEDIWRKAKKMISFKFTPFFSSISSTWGLYFLSIIQKLEHKILCIDSLSKRWIGKWWWYLIKFY